MGFCVYSALVLSTACLCRADTGNQKQDLLSPSQAQPLTEETIVSVSVISNRRRAHAQHWPHVTGIFLSLGESKPSVSCQLAALTAANSKNIRNNMEGND